MTKKRLVVLISGSGSNLQAILDAAASGVHPMEVVLVVSNRQRAYGLERARQAGVATLYFPLKPYMVDGRGREAYDTDLAQALIPYQPDLIVLAGWMHIFTPPFLRQFPQKIINLHPALPGTFPGAHAIDEAFAAYQQGQIAHSGCMVHYAIDELDAGPVIAFQEVPILPEDTLADFQARMHQTEHTLLIEAIGKVL